MSIVNGLGEKVELPREAGAYLEIIEKEWAGKDPEKWRNLVMVQLNIYCHLTHDQIALAMGLAQSNVTRATSPGQSLPRSEHWRTWTAFGSLPRNATSRTRPDYFARNELRRTGYCPIESQ